MTCAAEQVRQTFWPGGLDKGSMAAVIFRLRGRTRGGVWRDVVRRGRLDAHEGPCMRRREKLWCDGGMQRNSWDLIRCTVFRRVCKKRMAWWYLRGSSSYGSQLFLLTRGGCMRYPWITLTTTAPTHVPKLLCVFWNLEIATHNQKKT